MLFFVITKNLNLEILSKNFVTFKSWDGVKDEHFQYYGGSLKNPIFRGKGFTKNQDIGGNCLKGGRLRFCRSKGSLVKKGEGVDIPMHTMKMKKSYSLTEPQSYCKHFH